MGGEVSGQFFQVASRPAGGDRHRGHQRGLGVLADERRQSRGEVADGGGRRGIQAGCLRGEPGDG
ncbi:hypothetical protein KEF29_12100 [Streptomyces tuirus]|uniref:Uncharacterized protein n=1 Tax=Streptomyces tuirus TaxID=68278 RepID=A0A941IZN1_9ACTN|nr:hypothetical protein [Streptomyces tuirus]